MRTIDLDIQSRARGVQSSAPKALFSFICPCCRERLNVSIDLAGVSGPCPSCHKVIRAPQVEAFQPLINPRTQVTTSQIELPGLHPQHPGVPSGYRRPRPITRTEPVAAAGSFCAVKVIAKPPVEDDSWQAKRKRERKLSRRRRRFERLVYAFNHSRRIQRLKRVGILLIVGTLVLTFGVLYMNHRSGGKLLERVFGN